MEENRRHVSIAIRIWFAISLLVLLTIISVYYIGGIEVLKKIIDSGPHTNLLVTFLSLTIIWMIAGGLLILIYYQRINSGNVLTFVCFIIISFLYLNILRERSDFGDIDDYINAAKNLFNGETFHLRYIYPPFMATILQPFVIFGDKTIFGVYWVINFISLLLFYYLLRKMLMHYGFSANLSTIITFCFMAVNAPILRTMLYAQPNLHVINLIFVCLLFYERSKLVSALALAVAVHLKISPVIFVLLFLFEKDFKWLIWFSLITLSIALFTIKIYGFSPYHDSLMNLRYIYQANGLAYRDTSIDSFFRAVFSFLDVHNSIMFYSIFITKIILTIVVVWIGYRIIQNNNFFEIENKGKTVYNGAPIVFVLMMLLSPLVWEHHAVFVSFTYLILLKKIESNSEWFIFGFAYFIEFLLPTFDFFPWSYGRLVSPLIILYLIYRLSFRRVNSDYFNRINIYFNTLNFRISKI